MLEFKQVDTSAALILTLTELASINSPNYLFVFIHVSTKDTVSFVKLFTADESIFPSRYNQFTINPAVVFLNAQPGEWHYTVYQQASAVNTDPDLAEGLLESGKLLIDRDPQFQFTKYEGDNSYKTYEDPNGALKTIYNY